MPRYKLTVEYDGTGFVGWQRQDNGPSVQGLLEAAVQGFTGEAATVVGAGRTDAGVHAFAQVAHVDLVREHAVRTVRDALNDHIRRAAPGPRHVAVLGAEVVAPDFHARFWATGRRYRYRIVNRAAPLGLDRDRAWHVFAPLDEAAMHAAAQRLVGRHDFTTFRSVHCQSATPIKTLNTLDVERRGDEVWITAAARSFLHNQVRAFSGTLVQVGEGRWSPDDVAAALAAQDRARCGPTAPPSGLYLAGVSYDRGQALQQPLAGQE